MDTKLQQMDIQTASKAECPVCHQVPRTKVFQCVNGHSICEQCSTKVKPCPQCRSSRKRSRNLLAETLLDAFEFKCRYSEQGCEKTMSRGELSAHEYQCDQR